MRNLKRVLSLALACIMVIGMMVMGVSAADYGDYAEIEYTEAVEVMGLIDVLEGDDNGNFNPTDILTREQAAKIIAYMLLGKDNAEKLNANNTIFKDVAAGRWSAGYISYCATVGILAGVGDGNFDPTGELTGVAFGKMLLVALGYDPTIEGYVGADWATNIATDIIGAGIDVKGVIMSDALTREQAAEMAFKTLTADMVDYEDRGWEMTLDNGQTIVMGASKAASIVRGVNGAEGAANYAGAASNKAGYGTLQFCEKHFDSLTLEDSKDAYGRPGHTWWNKKDGLFFVDDVKVVYTGKVNGEKVAADLAGLTVSVDEEGDGVDRDTDPAVSYKVNDLLKMPLAALSANDLNINTNMSTTARADRNGDGVQMDFVDGKGNAQTVAGAIAEYTDNGKVVEIYANKMKGVYAIVTIEYTAATTASIGTNKDKTEYKFKGVDTTASATYSAVDYVDDNTDDTIYIDGTISRGSIVTIIKNPVTGVLEVYPTTTVVGTQTAKTDVLNTLVIDGTTYKVATGVIDDGTGLNDGNVKISAFPNGYKAANYYVDQYGYVVKTTAIASNQYVYVVETDATVLSALDSNVTVDIRVVQADGTVAVYNLPIEELKGTDGRIGQTSITTGSTLGAGDWVVKNTTIQVADQDWTNEGGFESDMNTYLKGKLFGYVVSGNDLILEALSEYTNGLTGGAVYMETDSSVTVNKTNYAGTTSYSTNSGNTTVLISSTTPIVVYDSNKKMTAVYTGTSSLPNDFSKTGFFVVRAGAGAAGAEDTAAASFVFIEVDNLPTTSNVSYAYVGKAVVTEALVNGQKIYTYNGTTADEGKVTLTKMASTIGCNGVYAYDADCKVLGGLNETVKNGMLKAPQHDNDTMIQNGNLVYIQDGWYEINSDTKIVYIDNTVVGLTGNLGMGVLKVENDNVTNVLETIFVVG